MSSDLVSVTLRAAGFVALFQAAGIAFFMAIFGDRLIHAGAGIRRLGLAAASGGILLLLTHQAFDAARMADDFAGLFDFDLQRLALFSTGGAAHLMQALGLALVALGLWRPKRFGSFITIAGAAFATVAFALTGHTSVHAMRWLLVPLLVIHLAIVAFWFGALAPLFMISKREVLNDASWIVNRFSAVATWLVPCIVLAGLAIALILAPDLSVLRRPYGQLLAVKLLGFILLMILAAFNKWRLTPMFAAGRVASGSALRRSIAIEYALIVIVLSVTAALTAFFSPEGVTSVTASGTMPGSSQRITAAVTITPAELRWSSGREI